MLAFSVLSLLLFSRRDFHYVSLRWSSENLENHNSEIFDLPSVRLSNFDEHNVTVLYTLQSLSKPKHKRAYLANDLLDDYMHTHFHSHRGFLSTEANVVHLNNNFDFLIECSSAFFETQTVESLKANDASNSTLH